MYQEQEAQLNEVAMRRRADSPERETELWRELNRQEGQITSLHDALHKLYTRLGPVLGSTPPTADSPDVTEPTTEVARRIASNTDQVVFATKGLQAILDALEL